MIPSPVDYDAERRRQRERLGIPDAPPLPLPPDNAEAPPPDPRDPETRTVACFHCGKPVSITFEPEGPVVCDPCADEYQRGVVEGMARTFGDAAFRCERCGMPTVGDPTGAKLCDPCEDTLHAEALSGGSMEARP